MVDQKPTMIDFKEEAGKIGENAVKPDVTDQSTTSPSEKITPMVDSFNRKSRKRGRPSKKDKEEMEESEGAALAAAKAVNTGIFTVACIGLGTKHAWPKAEKEEIMDKALGRYMALKGFKASPEVALIAAYSGYIADLAKDTKVQESVANKYGTKWQAWKARTFGKLLNKGVKNDEPSNNS